MDFAFDPNESQVNRDKDGTDFIHAQSLCRAGLS